MKNKFLAISVPLVILIVGIILLIRFAIAIPLKGVINIGNITGMACSLVLILYAVFFAKVNHFIAWGWHYIPGKIGFSLVGAILVGIVALVIIETSLMVHAVVANSNIKDNATVVVLGAKAHADHPSELLQTRLDATYTYLIAHPNAVAVLSGGQGKDEPITEAQCMFEYLTKRGIQENRLYLESASMDTRENIDFSMALIRQEKLNESIVIITNEFHEYRATMLAKNRSIDYYVYAADTPDWALPTYYVRELYGILHEWLEALQ